MEFTRDGKSCSFCGVPWSEDNKLIGGFGAQICHRCVAGAHALLDDPAEMERRRTPPWSDLTDTEMLNTLPDIVRTSDQVDEFLHGWVGLLRERRVSWQQIGLALGVTRQAAWQRFTRSRRAGLAEEQ